MNRAFTLLARSKIPQEGNLLSKNSRSQPHREGPAPISYRVLQVGRRQHIQSFLSKFNHFQTSTPECLIVACYTKGRKSLYVKIHRPRHPHRPAGHPLRRRRRDNLGGASRAKSPPDASPDFEYAPEPTETEELTTSQKNAHSRARQRHQQAAPCAKNLPICRKVESDSREWVLQSCFELPAG